MARKRMISPEIWESESFSELSDLAKIVFISLFSHADDEGRGRADTSLIKSMTFPYDGTRRVADIKSALSEIARSTSTQFYTVDGKEYYFMTSWKKWQKVDKPSPSKLPPPPFVGEGGDMPSREQFGEYSSNVRGIFGERSATNKIERNGIEYPSISPQEGETDGTDEMDSHVQGYLKFMNGHPYIVDDFNNPSELYGIDFELLAQKIEESTRYLKNIKSLKYLIRHYSEIIGDSFKDFSRTKNHEIEGKGDLQLWQEMLKAVETAKEDRYCEGIGYDIALFRMADGAAKKEMGELYKRLSPEIIAYFDPNSFLDLCKMDEKELKYERARFLKALPGIRKKITEESNGT